METSEASAGPHRRARWRIRNDAVFNGAPSWIKRGQVFDGTEANPEAGPLQLISLHHPSGDGIEFRFLVLLGQLEPVE